MGGEAVVLDNLLADYSGKRVLVTGGAGCIGSNLVRTLLRSNVERIVVLDDLSSSFAWNLPRDPIVRFVKGSILSDEDLTSVFSEKPDLVFHLAAHFANQNSIDHPEQDLMVNGLGTLKVLQHSRQIGTDRFIYASSGCSVYGSQAPLPLTEDFRSLHLDSPYQIHKLLGELYCNLFSDYYDLPIVIMRFFNVYGPGEIPGRYRNVIPNFMWRALNEQPLTVTGTGEETRDFTFVMDVVRATLTAGISSRAVGEAINVASGIETKVIDLANLINEITGNDRGVRFVTRRTWDRIERRRASIEKARELLRYEPETTIGDGLKETLSWFAGNKNSIAQSVTF